MDYSWERNSALCQFNAPPSLKKQFYETAAKHNVNASAVFRQAMVDALNKWADETETAA